MNIMKDASVNVARNTTVRIHLLEVAVSYFGIIKLFQSFWIVLYERHLYDVNTTLVELV